MSTTAIFNSAYQALPDARAVARLGTLSVAALCASTELTRQTDDIGAYNAAPVEVRFLLANETPAGSFRIGAAITVERGTETARLRVMGRRVTGAVCILTMGGANE